MQKSRKKQVTIVSCIMALIFVMILSVGVLVACTENKGEVADNTQNQQEQEQNEVENKIVNNKITQENKDAIQAVIDEKGIKNVNVFRLLEALGEPFYTMETEVQRGWDDISDDPIWGNVRTYFFVDKVSDFQKQFEDCLEKTGQIFLPDEVCSTITIYDDSQTYKVWSKYFESKKTYDPHKDFRDKYDEYDDGYSFPMEDYCVIVVEMVRGSLRSFY